jgi:NarL family two-component system response regulator LiaR
MEKDDKKIKVLLVDDHAVLRSGMRYILDVIDTIEVIGEASNGVEALEKISRERPDIVLMDILMPVMDGIEATRQITQKYPEIQVVILSSFEEKHQVSSALKAGAISYLTKNITPEDLEQSIRNAFRDVSTLSSTATRALMQETGQLDYISSLTDREIEVLEKLVEGMTNNEIGDALTISPATVKRHISSIFSKLGVKTRTEAAALALRSNLI